MFTQEMADNLIQRLEAVQTRREASALFKELEQYMKDQTTYSRLVTAVSHKMQAIIAKRWPPQTVYSVTDAFLEDPGFRDAWRRMSR